MELFTSYSSLENGRVLTSSFNVRHSASCQVTDQYVVVFIGVEVLRIPKKS